MEQLMNDKMPKIFNKLSNYRRDKCVEVLNYLNNSENVWGVLLGGSLSYKEDVNKSDIDLFCLLDQVEIFEKEFELASKSFSDIDVIINQGSFPWTGKLNTIFYKDDVDFSIDICMINLKIADMFFWEPDGYILIDKVQLIDKYRTSQLNSPSFTRQPFLRSNPFSMAVLTLKKIDKNLSRGHLWNALEQLNVLRRYIMQIIRISVIKDSYFLGRVDRDIEDVIPPELNMQLTKTTAIYESKDIALKTVQLIEIIRSLTYLLKDSKEEIFHYWILKQLKHEQNKLLN